MMKKFCKIFITNVTDVLPQKKAYLTSVIEKVCILSKSSSRITRYTFTYLGL